jgi:metallo-beta-lactamase family protein
MAQSIAFHGAAQTVTGSRHLLTLNGKNILVDCGLFQGSRELKERNWKPFPIHPRDIDAVVLTHGHTDHIGMLPRLVAQGYRGPIYATAATVGICKISLPDGGRLQEEEARYLNRKGLSRHQPALPLYTEKDAYDALKRMVKVGYNEDLKLPGGATCRYWPAGHILGSAFAEIYFENGERILMSGDLGRFETPIIKDPTIMTEAEYLVIESTYGDRLHEPVDPIHQLREVMNRAYQEGSAVIVPSFAIGRTQELLYYIHELQDQGGIPRIPIYVDSPMAVSATQVYKAAYEEHDEDMQAELKMGHAPLQPDSVQFVRDREQSKALNSQRGPLMIIAGSGMASGGRVVHHLKQRLSDPSTIVLFTGYQANGTLGRELVDGAETVEIMRDVIPVNAQIERMTSLSAHADQAEILRWLKNFKVAPTRTFIVHGEPEPQETLREKIREELGWENLEIPFQGQEFEL